MPTYTYRCTTCNKDFDIHQSIHDAPIKKCPTCNKPVEKVIGKNVGIQFVGSGFYINDTKPSSKPSKS